ncbi:hypothetical protein HYPSUDRAFT_138336 [Hypholoma sublateritium FD-334 SS-4]|uniref:Major facilitator superfamily (MFS) profile domain-containing protein n=1 Tax=Hypholoma sublateritium (strain FD-334 SS-4) TaxID=945553 RepID=A0A0D2P2H1_HYPSF|nr:hypothetical protein HYPSUDRAFT_138336 [Hypholoma sublateritium FD-334 SS-4]
MSSLQVVTRPEGEPSVDESIPLLDRPRKKPFYRPRPLWLVPFAVLASLVRGMTLAPRVEVFTQLSCNRLHGDHRWNHTQTTPAELHASLFASIDPLGPHFVPTTLFLRDSDDTEDPRRIPSARCQADPAVQAGAARLQTMMTTIMGLLSALTTGWWGHFGERNGRTKVLAISTLGLFLTDLTFILVSTPGSPLAQHGHKLLLMAPVIEGLLGGWSTLQSGVSAYLSDCTSPGSRAHIFSRFQGVVYLGFAAGPSIGGWLIQHPFGPGISGRADQGKVVTTVFWVAIACSFFNLLMMIFVFPESLNKKKMERAAEAARLGAAGDLAARPSGSCDAQEVVQESPATAGIVARFLSPLAVFLPVMVLDPSPNGLGSRKRRDWSLTVLAVALFGFMLSTGVYQIKYLYATHTYGWGAEQLSYYISFMGGGRALWLLCGLPGMFSSLIGFFKPKPVMPSANVNNHNTKSNADGTDPEMDTAEVNRPATTLVNGKKPKPTRAQLGHEIAFDLILTRCSLLVDVISYALVAILPAPSYTSDMQSTLNALATPGDTSFNRSQAMFVVASSMNGMASGAVPAIHSLALCMLQVRRLNGQTTGANGSEGTKDEEGTGALFGALAVLQAVGQMILGPLLFGLIYSGTVATFPKTIFVVAAGLMVFSLSMMLCVRNPVRLLPSARGAARRRRENGDAERGRSRVSKDLRGGAISYGSYGSVGSSSS